MRSCIRIPGILLITCSEKALQELRPGSREETCDGKVGRKECQEEEIAQGKALKCYYAWHVLGHKMSQRG